MKVDRVVVKETCYVIAAEVVCSLIMQGIFLALGQYDWTVLWGALLGGAAAVLNFWFLGLTIQHVTAIEDQADAKKQLQASYTIRYFALGVIIAIGVAVPVFQWLAVVLSLLFPRLWLLIMPLVRKDIKEEKKTVSQTVSEKEDEEVS